MFINLNADAEVYWVIHLQTIVISLLKINKILDKISCMKCGLNWKLIITTNLLSHFIS